ncbi:MAG: Fic family protein [Chitinophagaceae bacterium]|nr:Fic family protein [Chitinophagaceae bacterium]
MGKQQTILDDLRTITEALKQFPDGAAIDDIRRTSSLTISLRSFQRRLEKLMADGIVELTGATHTAKYILKTKPETNKAPEKETVIPLSATSHEILNILSVPFEKRNKTSYNRQFLDAYRPGVDFYLSAEERIELAKESATLLGTDQPAGTYAKNILQRLLIDLSWNSSRLEGNTYSLLDTERLLSQGEPAANKSAMETQMILNHKQAIEFMVAGAGEIDFNRYTITNLHAMLATDLLPDPAAPGRLRSFPVGIKKSAYTPTAIPQLIEEMFGVMLDKVIQIPDPHEQAFFIMVHLPYLQPFEDVNKRVSRLAANISLNKHNLVPLSFIGVPDDLYTQGLLGVYELNRMELLKDVFLWACRRSADRYASIRQTIGEPDPFRIKYRPLLQSMMTEIVSQGLDRSMAEIVIKGQALHLPAADSDRFIELVETELLNLHDGNFARYRVTPGQFEQWKKVWNK